MPATSGICVAAKLAWLKSMEHDDFWVALYGRDADIGPSTTHYTTKGEVRGLGYDAGGCALQDITFGITGQCAWVNWERDPRWEVASIRASSAMIYNRTKDNLAIAVFALSGEIVSTNGPWWMELPPPGETAVIRW